MYLCVKIPVLNIQNRLMRSLFIILTWLSYQTLTAQTAIEKALFELEDVIFTKLKTTPEGYQSAYKLMVKQPLDHQNPDAGFFYQKVYLSHRSFDHPVVIVTEGYDRGRNRIYEFSQYIQANQVQVEHRYFGESVPDSIDYRYLNLRQQTADLHKINQLIRRIYAGPFLATGISKGGMTTLFYRYFYPDDVDVSVPYVAPINVEYKDKRIYKFLDQVGTKSCREKIKRYQRYLLEHKDDFMPYLHGYAHGKNLSFEILGWDKVYEYAVLEYSFSFWQMGYDCQKIPTPSSDYYTQAKHFMDVIGIDFYDDKALAGYAPFYYQMGTEMGYYGFETDDFEPYITALGEEPSAVFPPQGVSTTFDPQLTLKANAWFENHLEKVIYINGANDTWSATAVHPDKKLDAVVFNLKGKNHRTARIKYMTEEERQKLEATLEKWLGIDVPAQLPKPINK